MILSSIRLVTYRPLANAPGGNATLWNVRLVPELGSILEVQATRLRFEDASRHTMAGLDRGGTVRYDARAGTALFHEPTLTLFVGVDPHALQTLDCDSPSRDAKPVPLAARPGA